MDIDLFSKIGHSVIDSTVDTSPLELPPAETTVCDTKDIQQTLSTILEYQKTTYVLFVTDSETLCNLILTLNSTLTEHKVSVLCRGMLYADDAIAEIERAERMLYTTDGTQHFPTAPMFDNVFIDEDGRILYSMDMDTAIDGTEPLYSSNGEPWGTLLPEDYSLQNLVGRLNEHVKSMGYSDRVSVANELLNAYNTSSLTDGLVLFHVGDGFKVLPVDGDKVTLKSLNLLLYEVLFGHAIHSKDVMGSLINDRLDNMDYPSYLFEYFERAFANRVYSSISCPKVDIKLTENTLTRLTLTLGGTAI